MSEITLSVPSVFLEDKVLKFFNRRLGSVTATVNAAFTSLGSRTYVEWYEYFKVRGARTILADGLVLL